AELAADLGRYLQGEPIRARATPAWERGWKWCRRRPAVAALIAVSGLALLAAGVGGVAYARVEAERAAEADRLRRDAEAARGAAEAQRERAEQERRRAEDNFRFAEGALHQLTVIGYRRLAHEPHMELVRRDLLTTALQFHRRFLARNGDRPGQRFQTALSHYRIGDIEQRFGRHDAAEKAYRAAVDRLTALLAESPGRREYRDALATTWNDLGLLFRTTQRPGDADTAA